MESAASTGRTHGSTDQPCIILKKTLANREPSTHGTQQTSISTLNMSAFGGKTNISDWLAGVR
jgi:hypothetical protein